MPSPTLDAAALDELNMTGRNNGCHRCGATEPGTVSGSFVPEYHPPRAFGAPAIVIPSCLTCSRTAGAHVTMALHRRL